MKFTHCFILSFVFFTLSASEKDPGAFDSGVSVYLALRSEDRTIGVLIVEGRGRGPFEDFEQRTIAITGTQLALSLRNLDLVRSVRATFYTAWAALASAVEASSWSAMLLCSWISRGYETSVVTLKS